MNMVRVVTGRTQHLQTFGLYIHSAKGFHTWPNRPAVCQRPNVRSRRLSTSKSSFSYNAPDSTNVSAILKNVDTSTQPRIHHAAIALGSNMGDRIGYIESALREMVKRDIRVLSVSKLYQTKAMYYENQDAFINGACYVETRLNPHDLLNELQDIENTLDRVRKVDKGPRTLDLDILLYDEDHVISERLEVPHKLMLEREFVLRPLADILPDYTFPVSFGSKDGHPRSVSPSLDEITDHNDPMYPVTVISPQLPLVMAGDPVRSTLIMAIMNITPDSFSDGGMLSEKDLNEIQRIARQHIKAGATILDIGGQSTRPHADLLTPSQELARVLPVVEAIRSMPEAEHVAISIDTFYAEVARNTIKVGADIINDVSGGLLDQDMFATVAGLGKTICLMHMRGNPHTMSQLTDYPNGVVQDVASELSDRVQEALTAGIRPWRILLDPGIGFAKTQNQNLQLLKNLNILREVPTFAGMPWLLGVSKKGFIGKITGVTNAHQRGWGTAAAVTASVAGGADIVRVHDVEETRQVVRMADAIYRSI